MLILSVCDLGAKGFGLGESEYLANVRRSSIGYVPGTETEKWLRRTRIRALRLHINKTLLYNDLHDIYPQDSLWRNPHPALVFNLM